MAMITDASLKRESEAEGLAFAREVLRIVQDGPIRTVPRRIVLLGKQTVLVRATRTGSYEAAHARQRQARGGNGLKGQLPNWHDSGRGSLRGRCLHGKTIILMVKRLLSVYLMVKRLQARPV